MKTIVYSIIAICSCIQLTHVQAQPAPCNPAVSFTTLEINNIRATYLVGGPHLSNLHTSGLGGFEVPKGSGKTAFHAMNFWIGGIDAVGTLKVAAQTYRQASTLGNGFWAGPLTTDSAGTTAGFCNFHDRINKINATDVHNHRNNFGNNGYQVPMSIANWPGNGDIAFGFDPNLAPYADVNANGIYDPAQGDYPLFLGDEALWMVYNDKGNTSGSGGVPIGIEVQETIFAFNRPGPFQNAQFMEYKIINRSSIRLDSVYYGHFVDPVLGNPIDDFIGCDVTRGMAFVYNSDDEDEDFNGYGVQPPAAGFAVFRGPYADFSDGIDNNLNGQVDELIPDCSQELRTETTTMWHFMSFENGATPIGSPTSSEHVFNYLSGRWKDGRPMVFGGNGYPGSIGATSIQARYKYPGNSDPNGFGIGGSITNPVSAPFEWTLPSGFTGPNVPSDRRFVMSMGPSSLMPGGINSYIVGALWARASSGGAQASLTALRDAKTQIQQAFNNCSLYGFNGLSARTIDFNQIRLYPNPAGEQLWLDLPSQPTANIKVEIYNLQGKLVRKQNDDLMNGNKIAVDLEGMEQGLYLLKISQLGTSKTFKFMKR